MKALKLFIGLGMSTLLLSCGTEDPSTVSSQSETFTLENGDELVLSYGIEGSTDKAQDRACKNSNFTGSIAGGFLSNSPFKSLDRRPADNPNLFKSDCLNPAASGQCWDKPRYKYLATFNNIRKWRGKACAKAVEANGHRHTVNWSGSGCNSSSCSTYFGPKIFFEVRGNDGKWRALKSSSGKYAIWEIPGGKTHWYHWYVNGSTKRDFRIKVRYAKKYDEFDFMMDK